MDVESETRNVLVTQTLSGGPMDKQLTADHLPSILSIHLRYQL